MDFKPPPLINSATRPVSHIIPSNNNSGIYTPAQPLIVNQTHIGTTVTIPASVTNGVYIPSQTKFTPK